MIIHDGFHSRFLGQDVVYTNSNLSVQERWLQIQLAIDECRDPAFRLSNDLTELCERAERSWTGRKLYLMIDLLILQHTYWRALERNKLTFPHVSIYHRAANAMWQSRLYNRWCETQPIRRGKRGRVIPASIPPVNTRSWMH